MYKVMIVEDEPLARDVLKIIIKENYNDISIVCEAVNGRQAVKLNAEYNPDIILMDIRIPGINGIEASKQIIDEYPDSIILVVTAYDDFNYIQQAMDLGIKGYLLKPIKDEDVIYKINKCIKYITDNRNSSNINNKIEKVENIATPLIQKEIISALISGDFDQIEIESYIGFLQEKIEAGYFMLISYEENLSNQINDNIRNKIYKDKIYEILSNYLPLARKCFFGANIGNIYVVFFLLDKDYIQKKILDEALIIALNIKRKIKVMTNIDIVVGIGKAYIGKDNMKHSYSEAFFALRKGLNKNEIIHYENLKNDILHLHFKYPFDLENQMLELVRRGDVEKAKKIFNAIIIDILNNCNNIGLVKEYLNQLISIIKRNLFLIRPHIKILDSIETVSELNKINNLDELGEYCKNHIYYLMDSIREFKLKGKDSLIVSMVREYR